MALRAKPPQMIGLNENGPARQAAAA